jgi:hypothetical protein
MKWTALLLLASLLLAGSEVTAQAGDPLPMRPLLHSDRFFDASNEEQAFVVLRNEAEQEAFLARYPLQISQDARGNARVPRFPWVDYEAEMAVVVALGQRGTGNTEVSIDAVLPEGDRLVVYTTEYDPNIAEPTLAIPVHIVAIPQDDRRVEFAATRTVRLMLMR